MIRFIYVILDYIIELLYNNIEYELSSIPITYANRYEVN
jgi:hypothetical protein